MNHQHDTIFYRPAEIARMLGIGLTLTNAMIRDGRLRSMKLGRARVIPKAALDDLVALIDADRRAA
jgi:excisionase family DNA binding protein